MPVGSQEQRKGAGVLSSLHGSMGLREDNLFFKNPRTLYFCWLGTLVVTYVKAINSGTVPCLENAVITLAQCENSAAVQKAADHYSEQMTQQVRLPTVTLQELLDVHAACEGEATAIFVKHSFKDDKQEVQKKLLGTIEKKKKDFLLQNEEASVKYCQAELRQFSKPLLENISRGTFCVPGGHSLYLKARKKVERDYELVPRKGVKANEVLQSFLQSLAAIEESIQQADRALTEAEKVMAAERAKNQAAGKELEQLRQELRKLQQKRDDQKRIFKECIARQKEKEKEREKHQRQREGTQNKWKDQSEGFKKKSQFNNNGNQPKKENGNGTNDCPLVVLVILPITVMCMVCLRLLAL
ncbi:guanylate-binding protein 4-like [Diceros bicornis minor]|uniref:guanylate-binding protein 4-like n=1 Tax=Diceros bicornis minor TaxID=77932 RepID=UPI0026EE1314|nr:guanylate-binding protein 4-like [Diceros bicornis minor]